MVFDQVKKDLMEADADIRSYLKHSDEYLKLKLFKILARFFTNSLQCALVSVFFAFTLFFLSIAAALAMSEFLDHSYMGFAIVGSVYFVLGIIAYIFKNRINEPVIRRLSSLYFDK